MKKLTVLLFNIAVLVLVINNTEATSQTITTVAGCGIGDDSLATKAELVWPTAIAIDKAGNTFIADFGSNRVRKIDATGVITSIGGNGISGYSGDGGPATAANLGTLWGIATDKHGNIFIVDGDCNCIRKIDTFGIINTIAGTGTAGFSGDGGPGTAANLNGPADIVIDTNDNVIFADCYNVRVRKINTAGIITTIVGDGILGTTGNGGPATASELGNPIRVAMDNKGNLYVAEVGYQCMCKVGTAGIIAIIGGTGTF